MRIGKIKSKHVLKELRFSGGYFLNEDAVNSRLLEENADKCKPLKELANVFNPPIFKRQFCKNTERAVAYCQSSDVTNALEGSDVYINKAQAIKVGAVVKDKQTLVTGFGTIGNTRLVNELSDGIAYANNVCRIEVHDESIYGFIYALMTSKYGRAQLNKNASGSVVRYIEAPGIKETLVPTLPDSKQQQIHNLIVEASKLRVEANKLLDNLIKEIEDDFEYKSSKKVYSVNIKQIVNGNKYTDEKRLESDFYQPSTNSLIKQIQKGNWCYLGDLSLDINRSGLRERKFVAQGVPLVTGQNLNMARLQDLKMLSRKFTRNIEKNTTCEEDILISVQGTIGRIEYVYKNMYQGVFASEQLSKVQIDKDKVHPGYVFAFLKSKLGLSQLIKHKTGSVIEWVKENNISSVVVLIPNDKGEKIGDLVNSLTVQMNNAFEKENEAINLIENEIEQWQES